MSGCLDSVAEERDEAKAERDAAWDRVAVLERQLAATREHALPLCPTPYTGPATGIDLVDRLRGIYVVPVVGERRFDASAINLEAADRIAELERTAETTRAEHAAALAEAESQLFDVRAERDDAREALSEADNRRESEVYAATAALVLATARMRELEGLCVDACGWIETALSSETLCGAVEKEFRAIVARIEKATT